MSNFLAALASDVVAQQDALNQQIASGRLRRGVVASVSGIWVLCTDGTPAARIKGGALNPGDEIYLGNVSDNPKKPGWFVIGAVGSGGPAILLVAASANTNSTTNTAGGSEVVKIDATDPVNQVILPTGITYRAIVTGSGNMFRDVTNGGCALYLKNQAGTILSGAAPGSYSGGDRRVQFSATVTGLSGTVGFGVYFRGSTTAGTTSINNAEVTAILIPE